jgi:hypothetical protein
MGRGGRTFRFLFAVTVVHSAFSAFAVRGSTSAAYNAGKGCETSLVLALSFVATTKWLIWGFVQFVVDERSCWLLSDVMGAEIVFCEDSEARMWKCFSRGRIEVVGPRRD